MDDADTYKHKTEACRKHNPESVNQTKLKTVNTVETKNGDGSVKENGLLFSDEKLSVNESGDFASREKTTSEDSFHVQSSER